MINQEVTQITVLATPVSSDVIAVMELVERNNDWIAKGKPAVGKIGLLPRPSLYYLANSMKNARLHDKMAWESRGAK